jgi:hypothetical protein
MLMGFGPSESSKIHSAQQGPKPYCADRVFGRALARRTEKLPAVPSSVPDPTRGNLKHRAAHCYLNAEHSSLEFSSKPGRY